MSPAELEATLRVRWPFDATSWSQTSHEVRDMSHRAREVVNLSELFAVNFRSFTQPHEWNIHGVLSIVRFYETMRPDQRAKFIDDHKEWIK